MLELWLHYTDPNGATQRVRVDKSQFVIGRHSDCDLAIADSRLSRVHAQIENFAGRWDLSDKGSSNGTELGGIPVFGPAPIYDGNTFSLGGFPVRVEIFESRAETSAPAPVPTTATRSEKPRAKPAAASGGSSIPIGLILAVPILALVLVSLAGGIAYLVFAGGSSTVAIANGDDDPTPDDDGPTNTKGPDADTTPAPTPATSGPASQPTPTPANLSETAKIEINGAAFLRKIAQNDPNMFLTTEQAKRVNTKIKSLSSSSAVTDNLKSAKQNGSQIKALAAEKSLKPQFLAVAAVAKLGGSRGDVVATAKTMAEVFEKLNVQIGSELADDCLLMVAAYEQGAAGDTMKLRNMLQNLANEVNESSRTIRTIWFLEKRQKITAAEFDRALTFLAIGTIAQNPKDFDVKSEVLEI